MGDQLSNAKADRGGNLDRILLLLSNDPFFKEIQRSLAEKGLRDKALYDEASRVLQTRLSGMLDPTSPEYRRLIKVHGWVVLVAANTNSHPSDVMAAEERGSRAYLAVDASRPKLPEHPYH